MVSFQSITDLATSIAKDTATVSEYFTRENLPQPNFSEDGPSTIRIPPTSPEVLQAHTRALAATRELHILLQGPTAATRTMFQINDLLILQFIHRFDIPRHVPIRSDISFADLSKAADVSEQTLTRFLRYAFTNWLFRETRPGHVGHTAATRALKESKGLTDSVGFGVNEGIRGSFGVVDALQKFGVSQEPIESGWGLANHATQPFYTELSLRHPQRAATVAGAMAYLSSGAPLSPIIDAYDFSLDGKAKTLVDIGGGHGDVATAIAKKYSSLKCIVQDLPEPIAAAQAKQTFLPDDVRARLDFAVHDLFDDQPIRADIYVFRAIFHNWPDKYCIKALKALIPALRKGARIVVIDSVHAEPGKAPESVERLRCAVDLNMMTFFNAGERTVEQWRELFKGADERFSFEEVKFVGKGPGKWMMPGILEVVWEG